MSGAQPVTVRGDVSLDGWTITQLANAITAKMPACTAFTLGAPLDGINSAVRSSTTATERRLMQLEQSLTAMLASPGACRAAEHYAWGWRAATHERWPEAIREFEKATEHYPYDAQSHLALAWAFRAHDRPDDAERALRDAITEGQVSEHAVALRAVLDLADLLDRQDREADADAVLDDAAARLPFCLAVASRRARRPGHEDDWVDLQQRAPHWVRANAPEVVDDEDTLPLDQERAARAVDDACAALSALGIEVPRETAGEAGWSPPRLRAMAAMFETRVRQSDAAVTAPAQLDATRRQLAEWQQHVRNLEAQKVPMRERRAHKALIDQATRSLEAVQRSVDELEGWIRNRTQSARPRADAAITALRTIPLRPDETSEVVVAEGYEAIPPRSLVLTA